MGIIATPGNNKWLESGRFWGLKFRCSPYVNDPSVVHSVYVIEYIKRK